MQPQSRIVQYTYKASKGWKIFLWGLFLIFYSLLAGGAWDARLSPLNHQNFYLILAIVVLGSSYWFFQFSELSREIILDGDMLRIVTSGKENRIHRSNLRECRINYLANIPVLELHYMAANREIKKFQAILYFQPDEVFFSWLDSIPKRKNPKNNSLIVDSHLRETSRETEHKITSDLVKYLLKKLTHPVYPISIYSLAYLNQSSTLMFMLAALAPFFMWVAYYIFEDELTKSEYRTNLLSLGLQLWVVCPFLFGFRMLRFNHLFDGQLATPAFICFAASLVSFDILRRAFNKGSFLISLIPTLLFGGLLLQTCVLVNIRLDNSIQVQNFVPVINKKIQRGRGFKSTNFILAPWGPHHQKTKVPVSSDLYNKTKAGDIICITTHQGVFGIQWYSIHTKSYCIDPEQIINS